MSSPEVLPGPFSVLGIATQIQFPDLAIVSMYCSSLSNLKTWMIVKQIFSRGEGL